MSKEPEIKDFCCINGFIEEVLDDLSEHINDDYYSIGIIANGELTQDLIRLLSNIQDDGEDDGFLFEFTWLDFSFEYDKEYLITVTNDGKLCCERAYYDNEYGKGYLEADVNSAFIYQDSSCEALNKINAQGVTIFGFESENTFDD